MSANEGWWGFDLDGTLAKYDTWRGIEHIGEPIAPMVAILKQKLDEGHECRIFTARVFDGDGRDVANVVAVIEAWCLEHIGRVLPVTCTKDFDMEALFDDRCIQVVPNAGYLVQEQLAIARAELRRIAAVSLALRVELQAIETELRTTTATALQTVKEVSA